VTEGVTAAPVGEASASTFGHPAWPTLARTSLQAYTALWPQYRMALAAASASASGQQAAATPATASAFSPFRPTEPERHPTAANPSPAAAAAAALSAAPLFHAAAYPYHLAAAAAVASSHMAELQRTLLQQQQLAEGRKGGRTPAEDHDTPSSTTQEPSQSKPKEEGNAEGQKKNPYSIDSLLKVGKSEDDGSDGDDDEKEEGEVRRMKRCSSQESDDEDKPKKVKKEATHEGDDEKEVD